MSNRFLLSCFLLLICGISQAGENFLWNSFMGRYGVGINGNGWACCKCCDDYCPKPMPCLFPPCRPWDRCVAPPPPCKDCK